MTTPNVLIVDDTKANLIALKMTLKGMPINVVEAMSGNDALGVLLRERIDLVLMDVRMPGMNGYETAACLSELDEYKEIPVVFVTGNDPKDQNSAEQFSRAPHIYKPFAQEEMKELIRGILAERHKEVDCA